MVAIPAPDGITLGVILEHIQAMKHELLFKISELDRRLTKRIDKLEIDLTARMDRINRNLSFQIDAIDKRLDAIETERPFRPAAK